jgi:hypothetical protein
MNAFKRHLTNPTGRWVLGASAAVLALSFLPVGGADKRPPFVAPIQALAKAPLLAVAHVAGVNVAEVRLRLGHAGVSSKSDTQTIQELVGADTGAQMRVLGLVFAGNSAVAR